MHSPEGSFEAMEKGYFYQLWLEFHGNLTAMARKSGKGRAAIRHRFEKWGWMRKTDLIVPEQPGPPPPPLQTPLAQSPPGTPSTLNSSQVPPSTLNPHPSTDLLTPETRAKLEAFKARRRKGKK